MTSLWNWLRRQPRRDDKGDYQRCLECGTRRKCAREAVADLEVLAAVKRWIVAVDAEKRASEQRVPSIRITQRALDRLEDLEEAARKLELAK